MLRPTFHLGHIRKIPIGVHWSLLVAIVFVGSVLATGLFPTLVPGFAPVAYWVAGLCAAAGLFGSVLAHELGHSFVARRNGVAVSSITLWMLGGVSALERDPDRAGAAFRIAVAGPAVSVGLAVVTGIVATAVGVAGVAPLVAGTLGYLALGNAMLAAFNLVPAAPLDGGRVLSAAIWAVRGDKYAAQATAATVGIVAGAGLAAFGIASVVAGDVGGLWLAALGGFVVSAAAAEARVARLRARLTGARIAEVATPAPPAPAWSDVATFLSTPRPPVTTAVPLVDWDGTFAGIVTLRDVLARPRTARLSDTAIPAARVVTARPDEDVNVVIDRLRPGSSQVIVVLDAADHPYAVVTPELLFAAHTDRPRAGRRPVMPVPPGASPTSAATPPASPSTAHPLPQQR